MEESSQRRAIATCLIRHAEQRQPASTQVLHDPLAHRFVRGWSRVWRRARPHPTDQALATLCMHRFLDEVMASFLADHAPAQVVLLDAGYDSRAWRMVTDLDGRTIFEVDAPGVLDHKAACLTERPLPLVDRRAVSLTNNMSLSAALDAAGLVRGMRTLFLWEQGALFRSRAAVKSILSTLHATSASGSVLAMGGWRWPDLPDESRSTTFLGEPLQLLIHPEDVGPFLSRQGFALQEAVLPDDLARRYVLDDRPPSASGYGLIARRR